MPSLLLISGDFASILNLLCRVMFVVRQIYSAVDESTWGVIEGFPKWLVKLLNLFCFKIVFSI